MQVLRKLVAAVVLCALLVLVVPTGAAPTGPSDALADSNVVLTPSSDYTHLQNGELVLDFSDANPTLDAKGLNPESVTYVADAFRVTNAGSGPANVSVRADSAAVALGVGGCRTCSVGQTRLAPGESASVGVRIDTRGVEAIGAATVEINVTDPEESGVGGGTMPGMVVDVSDAPRRSHTVSVRNVPPGGASVSVSLNGSDTDDGTPGAAPGDTTRDAITVESMDLTLTSGRDVALNVSTGPDPAADAPTFPDSDPLIGYVNVAHDAPDSAFGNATIRFSVAASALGNARNVRLLRYDDGGWVTLPTEPIGKRTFVARTPGFSTFAVVADRPGIAVTDVELDERVRHGEAMNAEVTVENTGALAGTKRVGLSIDGEGIASRSVRVPPDESVRVGFKHTFATPGERTVRVGGRRATVEVFEAETTTVSEPTTTDGTTTTAGTTTTSGVSTTTQPTATTRTTTPGTASTTDGTPAPVRERSGFPVGALGGVVAVLAVLVALVALARRRNEEEENEP